MSAHLRCFGVGLVSLSEEVEHPMDDDAMQFLLERHSKMRSILPYPVDTNHYVARDKVGHHIVKSDDVGIGVVIEVLLIDSKVLV